MITLFLLKLRNTCTGNRELKQLLTCEMFNEHKFTVRKLSGKTSYDFQLHCLQNWDLNAF